jgi:hypothetical protein
MLELGVDVGLSSVGLAMGPPTPPYNLLFGIGYAVAPPAAVRHAADEAHDSARQQAAARAAAAVAAASAQPQLRGVVHDAVSGAPIAEAVIRLPGRPENPLLSAADGSFVLVLRTASATLPTLTLEVRRTGYLPSTVAVALAPGNDRQVAIQMQPRPQPGRIQGLVLDASGGPVEARVRFRTGSAEPSVLARGGSFLVQLPAGSYEVEPEAAGFLAQRRRITVEAGQEVVLELRLRRRPRVSGISLAGERIVLRRGLEFEGQGGRLTAGSQAALDEVVDLLLGQPQPGEIWVEKCVGQGEAGMARREQQQLLARAVRDYLIGGGVAEGDVRSREVGPGRASRPATVPGSGRAPLCGVMLRLARPALPEPLLQ